MEITGQFLGASEIEEVGAKNYKVRKFYIENGTEEYPSCPEFQLGGDKNVNLVDDINVGDTITVRFDIQGKKYISKSGVEGVFTSLKAYGIKKEESATPAAKAPAKAAAPAAAPAPAPIKKSSKPPF